MLIEATRHVRDPDQGLRLMSEENRLAGQHAHREINRLVHNFVAGSMTLIDHTPQFMQENYVGTALKSAYDNRVKTDFASEPVAKFVQDLRNYMVHKGLPNSQMFIEFDNDPNSPSAGAELTTGVRYETQALLEGRLDRTCEGVQRCGQASILISIPSRRAILKKFSDFTSGWILHFNNSTLPISSSLRLCRMIMVAYRGRVPPRAPSEVEVQGSSPTSEEPSIAPPFVFPLEVAAVIDEAGKIILDKIRRIDFVPQTADAFPSERPIGATVTPDTMLETLIIWRNDSDGRPVARS